MSEGFDNYGLRIKLVADYQYDDGRRVGQFNQTTLDPGTDDILKMVIALIDGCYEWGVSRKDLIDSLKESLDAIYQEHVGPVYFAPETEAEYD